MSSDRPFFHRRFASLLGTSLCAASAFAGAPNETAGPLPAGGVVRPQSAAPPGPSITGEAAAAQLLPPPAPVAEGGKTDAVQAKAAPSPNVTINLINRLVERGVLPKEDAEALIKQAEADAVLAREQMVATQAAVAEAQAVVSQAAPILAIPPQLPPTPDIPPFAGAESAVRVTYIPESVKAQIRDEIKAGVLAEARAEHWAAPRSVPEWTTRIRLFGDVRTRYEGIYFGNGNDNTGAFPNFNAVNTSSTPFDVSGTVFSPQLNVDQDRTRIRLRVRFGAEADLGEGFTAGLRLATGESNSPVSPNQSLGLAGNGQGGNFSKYAIWLDRGFLRYELAAPPPPLPLATPDGKSGPGGKELIAPRQFAQAPDRRLVISLGRFDNPFYTTDLIFDDDLGFDGVAAQVRYQLAAGFTPFLNGGAFPFFNTDLNFSSNRSDKFPSTDKWLYAGQLGFDWKPAKDFKVRLAAGYYIFDGAEGQLSTPYTPLNAQDAGNTDGTRPAFAQKGNTYRPLRNIVPTADNNFGTINQFQYFGLATPFRVITISGQIEYSRWEPFHITAFGEYAQNTAWSQPDINAVAVNNRGPNTPAGALGPYDGGNNAWIAGLRVGNAVLAKRWDWNVGFNYRYVESDAVIDGFNDSDFGGGGTNVQGYTIAGTLALGARVALGLRWMSANEIAGPPLTTDILQVDVSGKF